MNRFLVGPLLALAFALPLHAGAQPVRGLIVKLKPPSAESSGRETPQAARERLATVAQGAGVAWQSQDAVGAGHRLMRLASPLQGEALEAALRRLRLHPDVASVEPDVLLQPAAVPNDPGYATQWHLSVPTPNAAAINMPPAWDRTTGGPVVVAVLDTGVRKDHPDLAGQLLAGYDFVSEVPYANDGDGRDPDPSDPGDWVSAADKASQPALFSQCSVQNSSWHGTFITGQIAAATNNGIGIAGINWGTQVLPVRVSGKCGALLSDILDATRWAAGLSVVGVPPNPTPARVINLSFGGDVPCTQSYQDVIDEVAAAGVLVVVAAGNSSGALKRPADCRGVLAVGAVQPNGLKTDYSNVGANMGLMAPGGSGTQGSSTNLYSSLNLGTTVPATNGYGYKQGTSFSAPLAAGVASLMLTLNPALTPAQLVARLQAGARPHTFTASYAQCDAGGGLACNCTTAACGAGLLDAGNSTLQALNPVVLIAPVGSPGAGATITLDGRASAAAVGAALVGYRWELAAGSGASIQSPGSAVTTAVLSQNPGNFVFRLTVTDNAGRSSADSLSVSTLSGGGGSGGSSGGGGGSTGWLWGAALWLLAGLAWRRRA
ncbi:S8 family peptidase [Variovorax terrae]|uniref:S8 family peptidase n=1 Tax=Variovorax terrae TaxID=2923278 RepID=A0A9X1W0W8_9BURK|nr:S8 family peptidase [Variovorax terrae]MCJ0765764.1 S8 family peptidase [Variovorax terrae]